MRRLILAAPILILAGCSRGCQSPVAKHETVYLRGSADPEIRLVLMDDRWGTEDRTASVINGRYEFAWTGSDLTALLGGERSFTLRAPAQSGAGDPYVESEEFYLRRTMEVALHLWRPRVDSSVERDGTLRLVFDPLDARHGAPSRYAVSLAFSRSITRLDGSRETMAGSLTVAGSPAGTAVPSSRMAGRDHERVTAILEATGGSSPALTYHAGSREATLPVPPEERLALGGTASGRIARVVLRSLDDDRSRSADVDGAGRYEFVWSGRQLAETLGQTRVVLEAGATDDPARIVSVPFRLADLSSLPSLRPWDADLVLVAGADGGLTLRFAAAQGPDLQSISRYGARFRYGKLGDDGRHSDAEASADLAPGETALSRDRIERLLPDRVSEEIRMRIEAHGRGHPVDLTYRSAAARVALAVTGSKRCEIDLGSVQREYASDTGAVTLSFRPVLAMTLPIREFAAAKNEVEQRKARLRARVSEILYARSLDSITRPGGREALAEEVRREINALLGRTLIQNVVLRDFETAASR